VDDIDSTETFATAVKFHSVRAVLSIAAMIDLEMEMDAKQLFLTTIVRKSNIYSNAIKMPSMKSS